MKLIIRWRLRQLEKQVRIHPAIKAMYTVDGVEYFALKVSIKGTDFYRFWWIRTPTAGRWGTVVYRIQRKVSRWYLKQKPR